MQSTTTCLLCAGNSKMNENRSLSSRNSQDTRGREELCKQIIAVCFVSVRIVGYPHCIESREDFPWRWKIKGSLSEEFTEKISGKVHSRWGKPPLWMIPCVMNSQWGMFLSWCVYNLCPSHEFINWVVLGAGTVGKKQKSLCSCNMHTNRERQTAKSKT